MKRLKHTYILFASLLLGACSDYAGVDSPQPQTPGSDEYTLSLEVSLQDGGLDTRDGESLPTTTISDGSGIDVLKYELYELDEKSEWVRLKLSADKDQISVRVSKKSWPVNIKLSLDPSPSKKYRMAFWAQNSKCDAYDTDDLSAIKVNYSGVNNDETRDAFTGYLEIYFDASDTQKARMKKVVLHRPFAQINIGTSGADYANLIYNSEFKPSGITVTQSTISVKGVADTFNALIGVATSSASSQNEIRADFDWDYIPAWINRDRPVFDSGYTKDKDHDPFVESQGENFLKVKLNKKRESEELLGYVKEYPTLEYKNDEEGNEFALYLTETFKYLSMCYVLVPSDIKDGATVDIEFNFRQKKGDYDPHPIPLIEKKILIVPVKANYRTNIIAGLYSNQDDPTSIFNMIVLPLEILTPFDYHYTGGWEFKDTED